MKRVFLCVLLFTTGQGSKAQEIDSALRQIIGFLKWQQEIPLFGDSTNNRLKASWLLREGQFRKERFRYSRKGR